MSQQTVFNGRYEIHRRIARGGMADVFLARDQLLDRPVAVKVLFKEFATDPLFVARFRREAQAAANLNHPNIVGVYDWGEQDDTYFIVMEFVDGRSLADIIRADGPLHPDRAADVATDIAAGLGFAHRNGVVHRDIKPGNVLISPSGQVKVADFGIARALDTSTEENLTQTGSVMGTATYFAPEQAQGLPLDPRSDLYALGVVMYEMVVGRPPFSGDSPVSIAYKHVQAAPMPPRQLNPDLPAPFEQIVLKLLEKDPAARYPSAEDLRADLRRFRHGDAPLAATAAAAAVGATQMVGRVGATQAVPEYVDERRFETEPRAYDYREPSRSGWFVGVLILLLVVLAGLLFLLARTLGVGEDEGEQAIQVEVPDVINQPVADATRLLEAAMLVVVPVNEENDSVEPGIVFAQEPRGVRVDEGTEVTIRVAQATTVPMPGVIDSTFEDAEATLEGQGFTMITRVDEFNEDVDPGLVFAQDPAPGTDVAVDTPIRLTVSRGAEDVVVDDVGGRTLAEASNILGRQGFETNTDEQPSETVEEGLVVGTNPPAGTALSPGERVTIIVSTGPEETDVAVPNVLGQTASAAGSQLQQAGFVVQVEEQALEPGDDLDGRVISQVPNANQMAPTGSTVTITVGRAEPGNTNDSFGG